MGKFVWRGSPSRHVLSGVVVSAASLAQDEWKRILLDQIDSLHRLRARRALPVRWIMEIKSLLAPAFQNSTRALQYHKSRRDKGGEKEGPLQRLEGAQLSCCRWCGHVDRVIEFPPSL